ncbi:Spc98 family-domain-containing protein [Annulohypoxylon maeteangense]|uniref:Spc98 family-domain-containing protein n=1 Tax=Annulohypoxylon maeteangense TaxID=1927788 RepID=UPI002008AE3D|nr:Spc98 family-domain-containing protein [Annulohypoxylon maeteangense]KAI0885189.1 Spc98 family-domain-containing protein [Annulohypoxylon maeteangense]
MAFAATLGALTEELVEVITSTSIQSDPQRFNVLKESSLRSIRYHNFLRTNQFDVEGKLDGFEEHFRVVNRDKLADALRERLDALSHISNNWTPDILQLLLLLEDQPIKKTKLADLELLKAPEEDPGPPLRWEDISKEGWDQDRDLWKNARFNGDSSDEYLDDISNISAEDELTSVSSTEAQYQKLPTDFIINSQNEDGLSQVRETQLWRNTVPSKDAAGRSQKIIMSEFQAVREVLFMLSGLKNTLFDPQGVPSLQFQLKYTSWEVYKALLGSLSEAGRQLYILREFAKHPQHVPLLQVFQEAVQTRLRSFDIEISNLQRRHVDIQEDVVISIARVLDDVNPHLRPLASLSDIVHQLQRSKYPHPFHYLELLYDSAKVAQLEGNDVVYEFIATLFFECFQVYLRSIRLWMEAGELIEDDKTFFISSSSGQVPKSQVWADQFTLRKTSDGILYVPRFLQPAASKILITGKSVVVLKLLGKYQPTNVQTPESSLEVSGKLMSTYGAFAPFSEIFNDTFDKWMESKHHAASTTLQRTLFESCNLWSVLDSLRHVYLMSDGSRSDSFTFAIFNNLDLLNANWHDRFNLTSLAHEAFDALPDAHQIAVNVSADGLKNNVTEIRRSVHAGLPFIRIIHRLSWPIRIILSDESLTHYQAAFTFLLQLRRATYVLHKHRFVSDSISGTAITSSDQSMYYGLRAKFLWFCNILHSYLNTLVLEPLTAQLHETLRQSDDVTAMVASHSAFTKQMIGEMCLGGKLDPIRQCILDMFDLTIRLQDARQLESEREQEEFQELSRLSVMSSPMKHKRYLKSDEEEDETFLFEQDKSLMMQDKEMSFTEVLREIQADFDRHLKFISSGLRGVARASGDTAAVKWDTLAEMLEVGIQGRR